MGFAAGERNLDGLSCPVENRQPYRRPLLAGRHQELGRLSATPYGVSQNPYATWSSRSVLQGGDERLGARGKDRRRNSRSGVQVEGAVAYNALF